MNSNGILHLGVTAKGQLRVYEDPAEAKERKAKDEVLVQLSLTKPQMATVLKAEGLARELKQS